MVCGYFENTPLSPPTIVSIDFAIGFSESHPSLSREKTIDRVGAFASYAFFFPALDEAFLFFPLFLFILHINTFIFPQLAPLIPFSFWGLYVRNSSSSYF